METNHLLAYKVGPLLYMPANQKNIVEKIRNKKIEYLTSICLCLEDSIQDEFLPQAEKELKEILRELKDIEELPLIFVRVRSYEHLAHIYKYLGEENSVVTGYVLPKFDEHNIDSYLAVIKDIVKREHKYFMPILESDSIASCITRRVCLDIIIKKIEEIKEYILNIRVGANDLCHIFGLRRRFDNTVYDIGVVRDALIDILSVFSREYVVSGPVCEYFDSGISNWQEPLVKEIQLDLTHGFIGKTCIHPSQLKYVYENLKVSKDDYIDACQVLNWTDDKLGVLKSSNSRMNERKCSTKWAEKMVYLANIYGLKE